MLQKIITVVREGARLPVALAWHFPKFRRHHWPELPQMLVISKVNHPTMPAQHEGAKCHYGDGPRGCEVPSVTPKIVTHSAVRSFPWWCYER